MGLFKKFQYYKRALQLLFIFNIVVVTAGIVAAIAFYSSKKALVILTEQNSQRLIMLEGMHKDIMHLSTWSNDKKDTYFYRRHLENLKEKLEVWPDSSLAQIAMPRQITNEKLSSQILYDIYDRVSKEQSKLRNELTAALKEIGNVTNQLMLVAFVTIFLGVVLPWFLFKRVQHEMNKTRFDLEKKISHWVAHWAESYRKHGDKPFQDVTFWIETVALTVETIAPSQRHPAFQFLAEFAPILRRELEKERDHKKTKEKVTPLRS